MAVTDSDWCQLWRFLGEIGARDASGFFFGVVRELDKEVQWCGYERLWVPSYISVGLCTVC